MKFTKMQGIGNDYVYVNCFEETVADPERVSEIISDRHFGIGADGLVLIMPSDKADFRMRMFNADGSEGNMCGNATRCIGKFVYDNHLTDKTNITLETRSGIKKLTLYPENGKVKTVLVDMGKAVLKPADIPMNVSGDTFINKPIAGLITPTLGRVTVDGKEVFITAVSMGNPHAVTYVDDVDSLELEKIGPSFENHPLFPERVNTEFIKILDESTMQMRVWERGSGETWACGTGACAATAASVLNGYFPHDKEITVKLRGGDLFITYKSDGTVLMRGPAETVFTGEIDV